MKRMTQILSFGLLLSISSVALAERGHDRHDYDGYYGGQHHNAQQDNRYRYYHNDRDHHRRYAGYDRRGHRHYAQNNRYARRHSHQGRYCYDWHPRGYVAPLVHYGYNSPGLVIVYQPRAGLYFGEGH